MNCNCCWFIQPDTAISRNRNGSRDFVMRKVTLSPGHRQCTALSAIPCCLCRSIFRTLREQKAHSCLNAWLQQLRKIQVPTTRSQVSTTARREETDRKSVV